jgi:hypothetical protein
LKDRAYFQQILNASFSPGDDLDDQQILIDWTQDEAILLLQRAAKWWDGVEAMLAADKKRGRPNDSHELAVKVFRLLQLLAIVILPRLGTSSDDVKSRCSNTSIPCGECRLQYPLRTP